MPYLTVASSPDGLAVEVLVGPRRSRVQTLRSAGQPVPPPIALRALLDTGADVTSVVEAAVGPLGLIPVGNMAVSTASGLTIVNRYVVSLTILAPAGPTNDLTIPNLQILGLANAPTGFDVLLGLDVLAACLLVVDGRARQFTLAF